MSSFRADLKVVVADGNMQATLVHPRHDPGCWKDGPELLALKHQHYRHGLLALDCEGCNSKRPAADTRQDLQERLDRLTSPGCGSVLVLRPELEIWMFAGSTEVDRALGWQPGTLTPWLVQQGVLEPGQVKPARPKEAVEHAMNQKRQPRSSSVYRQLSRSVGLSRCTAPVFTELKSTLQQWFPVEAAS